MPLLPPIKSKRQISYLPKCGKCGLWKKCNSPKMKVFGKGRQNILIVGEAPGLQEDEQGRPFIGKSGNLLKRILWEEMDVDLDTDCWLTNAISCRPKDNRTPSTDEIDYCRPLVMKAIRDLNPELVLLLGAVAVKSVIGVYYRDKIKNIYPWVGQNIPIRSKNFWLCCNYHPAYVARRLDEPDGSVIDILFRRYLRDSLSHLGRPWTDEDDLDLKKQVKIELDTDMAAEWIHKVCREGGSAAWDLETNMLKPDGDNSRIASAAICWNKGGDLLGELETRSFLYEGAVVGAMKEFVQSDVRKIGANNKFEERWSRAVIGAPVNNWVWDTMLSAHHLDNREGITSVKCQAFLRFGIEPWDDHIKPYLQSKDSISENRVFSLGYRDLLMYNGLDALIEYMIATEQIKEMRENNAG